MSPLLVAGLLLVAAAPARTPAPATS
ncbi:HEAT repeat domain-containing protein, partial [Myxococcus llanfairpwllgwyngyllgogerychwyrndrobwllllantysiliogogogochensis]